ncbi:MAG: glutamyl-tRNA reductase [Alphaproteobacteria bacterium]|nr:glutamyl-tRNA reductase [Alphaproteobacteria bacterium]
MGADARAGSGLARLGLVGLSHRTADLAVRDRIAAEEEMAAVWLDRLAGVAEELLVLVTCDRVEACLVADARSDAIARVEAAFAAAAGIDALGVQAYRLAGAEAVRHVFRVASALDSAVVGEPQVLGQLKDADRRARAAGTVGPTLDLVLSGSYAAAKRVRTETAIGERPVSIAAAAVHVARDVHGELGRITALAVGTGEMGEVVIDALSAAGVARLMVADTGGSRPAALARRHGATLIPFAPPAPALAAADVVVAAAGTGRWTLEAAAVREAMRLRRHRPLFIVDAALPNDVDPAVERLDGAFLYTVEDLERLAVAGRARRAGAVGAAEEILSVELARLLDRIGARDAGPAIRTLAERFEAERQTALADAAGDAERATELLVRRLLHGPATQLRRLAADDPAGRAAAERLLGRLFDGSGEDRS